MWLIFIHLREVLYNCGISYIWGSNIHYLVYSIFTVPGSEMRFKSIRPAVFAYDFYLSFVPDDEDSVQRVRDLLSQHKSDVKFFIPNQQTQENATEERIFSSMKICSRFVQRWLILHSKITIMQIRYIHVIVCRILELYGSRYVLLDL